MKQKVTTGLLALVSLVLAACVTLPGVMGDGAAVRPLSDQPPASAAEQSAKVHVDLGMAYLGVARYDVALDEARAALASDPSYGPAFHLMGVVYMMIEDKVAARDNFERALRIAPSDPEFNNSYGWFQCVNGQEKEGLERLALAARNPYYRTPTRPYTNAGLCQLRLKNDEAAEMEFRRALQADGTNGQAMYHIAAIAYRRGLYEVARGHLVEFHQHSEPTAESIWLGVRTERRLGKRDAEASYASQLRGRFAGSREHQAMGQGNYE
jgi:type IV pilus assembly protein PilF